MISVSVIEWFFQILLAIGRQLDSARIVILLSKQSDMKGDGVSRVSCDETTEFKPCKESKRKQTKKARLEGYVRILIDWWF